MHALTDAQWSPIRSSIFYTTKMDGKNKDFILQKKPTKYYF
jgi:hypothetical protein